MTAKTTIQSPWYWLAPVCLLVALALPGFAGGRWSVDAGWYAGISLQVFREGDFWTLHTGEWPYFNKPPLAFWLHGFFLWFLGPELWVFRATMVLAAAGCVAVTAQIARRLADPWTGLLSGLILASTVEFARHTDRFRLDYLHTLLILLGLLALAEAVKRDRPRLALLAGPAVGLALMTKPIAALALFPAAAVWLLWISRPKVATRLIPAAGLAIAVAAPWHLSMLIEYGREFARVYFQDQSIERAIGAEFAPEPWWWYLKHLAQTYWPWLVLFLIASAHFVRGHQRPSSRDVGSLAFILTFFGLIALSLFADKREHYLFPIYPAMALLSGVWLAGALPTRWRDRSPPILPTLAIASLLLSIVLTLIAAPRNSGQPALPWHELYTFIEHQKRQGLTEIWDGEIKYEDAGMIYAKNGLWPRAMSLPDGSTRLPPAGALVIYADAGEHRPPNTVIKPGYWWDRIVVIEWPAQIPQDWNPGDPAGDRPARGQSSFDDSPP